VEVGKEQEEMLTVDFPSRQMKKGKDFMMKQELIDAAEASGLSRDAIGYNSSDSVYRMVADYS
jgi:hypothetical protein